MNQSTKGGLPEGPTDAELVREARSGSTRALDELIARHYQAVFGVALAVLREPDRAADVAQEACIKAIRGLAGFRGEAAFRTWLLRITRNEARAWARGTSRRREVVLDESGALGDGDPGPEARTVIRTEAERARKLVERLPEKQRLAVTLRIDHGLSFREVGEVIDSSEGAARVNYHHGIKKLRRWMS